MLSDEAFESSDAGVVAVVRPCVTSRIWFDRPETEHVDPAVDTRHDRDDVNGIHVMAQEQCMVETAS